MITNSVSFSRAIAAGGGINEGLAYFENVDDASAFALTVAVGNDGLGYVFVYLAFCGGSGLYGIASLVDERS